MRIGISIRLVVLQVLFFSVLGTNETLLRFVSAQGADNAGNTHLYFITNHGCAPCKQVEPGIEALKREGYPVTTVYFDANRQWATQMGVDRTPTVIMISNKKMVGRHAGLIDAVTLKQWFAAQGIRSGAAFANRSGGAQPNGTKVVLAQPNSGTTGSAYANGGQSTSEFSSPTMLRGTSQPGDKHEQLALQATVRLKVEDPEGTSYATGTVIHSHRNECLVMTCGHVFRDAGGKGVITAEYGFASGNLRSAVGQLISYDAGARDIGLVSMRTSEPITPVPVANQNASINRGLDVFSIGCDHGDAPTIRRSRIKNRAAYDGAIKYDIYGRPVDGRSGGGMFTKAGELIGVCNAAAVEVDEGIYTALDTIYWQLASVNLQHLFSGDQMLAASSDSRLTQISAPGGGLPKQTFANAPGPSRGFSEIGQANSLSRLKGRDPLTPYHDAGTNTMGRNRNDHGAGDKEIIILVRSKSDPSQTKSITIENPGPALLDYLDSMNTGQRRQMELARLRKRSEDQVNR